MEYLLKTSAVVAIFYLTYKLFLERDTFFESNRWFLLLGLITSFLLPLLVIPVYIEQTSTLDLSQFTFTNQIPAKETKKPFSFLDYLPIVYLIGFIFFSVRLIIQFVSLLLVILKNNGEKIGSYIFIKTNNTISPFSFFNWIVFNPNQFNELELEQIIIHEKAHAKQSHSLDILLTHISCIVLWFNPFIWLYNKDLKQNLEFIADQVTANNTDCKKSYQYTLLKTSVPSHQMALSNNFYNSLIKKRIVMLHKSKSKKINQIKYALVIPVLVLFLMSFNTKEIYVNKIKNPLIENLLKNDHIEVIITKDFTNEAIETLKKDILKEGYNMTIKGLKRNKKVEIIAIKIEIKSKLTSATFNIDSDEAIKPIKITIENDGENISIGNSDINKTQRITFITEDDDSDEIHQTGSKKNVIILKTDDSDENFTKEEIIIKNDDTLNINKNENKLKPWKITIGTNAVSDTVNWTSSKKRVGLNWVSDDEKKASFTSDKESKTKIVSRNEKEPLFILDGKESKHSEISKLNPDNIDRMDVLKGESATKKYGIKGEHGVVEITTKNDKRETIYIKGKPMNNVKVTGYGKTSDSTKTIKIRHKMSPISEEDYPLFVVDGKITSKKAFEKLPTDSIKKMEVLNGEKATKKYGKKAKNGVVEITTKE